MGTSSLQHSDNPQLRPGKKLSFSLPSFRKPSGERQRADQVETNAEERARVRKAAAWQWYTRGVGEVVAPTKASLRPAAHAPPAANSPAVQVGDTTSVRGEARSDKQQQQMPLESQPRRAASRFQAEASVPRPARTSSIGAASSPLYDEFELSSLRTHMAAFVQRLQVKQQKAQDELPAAAQGDQKTAAAQSSAPAGAGGLTAAGAHSATAFHKPLTALHRFFRRVIAGSLYMPKNTRNSRPPIITPDPSPAGQERPLDEKDQDPQYHYHHYIHHHHHHYHYGNSSEDGAAFIGRRRHSESSGIRPQIPSPWEEVVEGDYGEAGEEESPIQAYLARRRRYSDSFAHHINVNAPAQKAVSDDEGEGHRPCMKPPVALQLPRRYNSERFISSTSANKIPGVEGQHAGSKLNIGSKGAIGEGLMQSTDVRSCRRRHSAEILMRDGSSLGEGGGGAARGAGGKTEGGKYKLGGAPAGGAAAATQVARRRHSEASYRRRLEMNDQYDNIMGLRGKYVQYYGCEI